MECDRYFPSEPFVVLTVDQFVGHGGSSLERQRQDGHFYRKTGALPLICRKYQSRLFKSEKLPKRSELLDVMHATRNYVNLQVCSKHKCMDHYSLVIKPILISWRFVVNIKSRAVFNAVSNASVQRILVGGVRQCWFILPCDWSRTLAPSSRQIGCKLRLKLVTALSPAFSPRFRQFICVYFDFS